MNPRTPLHLLKGQKMFCGMGYSGRKPQEIARIALELNALVVDIRLSPISRCSMWHRKAMQEAWGARYCWIGDWGNVKYKTGGISLKDFDAGLIRVKETMRITGVENAILLCACKDSEECHRTYLLSLLKIAGHRTEEYSGKTDEI